MKIENQTIQDLLSNLSNLYLEIKEKEQDEGKESFNIFRTLHKENDEVRLHSRFISFLLSPKASHDKGSFFLNRFLEKVDLENFNVEQLEVFPTEEHKSEYRNIDILLINRQNGEAIIIENKIYAGDSITEKGGQIDNYIDTINNEGIELNKIHVFYLTLWGYNPSVESYNKYRNCEAVNLENISYQSFISEWLKQCINDLEKNTDSKTPFLETCLKQYLSIVKELTNYIEMEDLIKMSDEISNSKESLQGAKLLLNEYENLKLYVIQEFWDELESKLKFKKFSIINELKINSIYDIHELKFKTKNVEFFIYHENNVDECLYWGFYPFEGKKVETTDFKLVSPENEKNYYRKYFEFDIHLEKDLLQTETRYLHLQDFSKNTTFNLINKNYRAKVIEALVKEINDTISELETKI